MARCKGSQAQTVRIDTAEMGVGDRRSLLVHPACDCATGCRRVALFSSPPQPTPDLDDDFIVKLVARVRFGDNCDGGEVEVDWKRGVVLDLLGCYTAVDVELVEKLGEGPFPEFSLTALSACCGAGGARGVATRTYPQIVLAPSTVSDPILVPPFAYAVAAVNSAGTADYLIAGSGGAIIANYQFSVPEQYRLLPGGAYTVRFVNSDETNTAVLEPVFLIGV